MRDVSWLPLARPLLETWPTTQACALTGNRTINLLFHRLALSPLRHTSQGYRIFDIYRMPAILYKRPTEVMARFHGFPIPLTENFCDFFPRFFLLLQQEAQKRGEWGEPLCCCSSLLFSKHLGNVWHIVGVQKILKTTC